MEDLCARIRTNDASLDAIRLDGIEYDAEGVSRCSSNLLLSFSTNTTVTKVYIGERIVRSPAVDLTGLLLGLGRLQSLQRVEVAFWDDIRTASTTISACVLAKLLQSAPKLQSIVFWPFLSISGQEDLEVLNQAFHKHPKLEEIHLVNILRQPPVAGSSAASQPFQSLLCLGSLVESLATIPNLTHLQLAPGYMDHPSRALLTQDGSVECLLRLVQTAPRLKSLTLRNVGLTNDNEPALAEAIRFNTSLEYVNLRYNRGSNHVGHASFVDVVVHDNFHLHYLDLDWKTKHTSDADGRDAQRLQCRMDFHLTLNRLGRYTWLQDSTATFEGRVGVLAAAANYRDDSKDSSKVDDDIQVLEFLFFLLVRNPSVVCEASRRGNDGNDQK